MRQKVKHGIIAGRKYRNNSSIGAFLDYNGNELKQHPSSEILKAKLYRALCDGSLDTNTTENEVKCKCMMSWFVLLQDLSPLKTMITKYNS